MKKTTKKLDDVLQGWLDEHKLQKSSGKVAEKDFMDVMLEILDGESCFSGHRHHSHNPYMGRSFASQQSPGTKESPRRIGYPCGGQRLVDESDIKNLVYIQAIIKENLRLYPPTQLIPPPENSEDCIVGGYYIPAGTRLFVNLWKIHRDPQVWPEPLEFQPERFLTTHKDVDLRGQHFEFMPFGSGRRVCPGTSLGLQVVQFTLASLVHAFEIALPGDEDADMTESFGLSNIKVTPLDVTLTPRLPPQIY
ncbi:hypothetical protein Vadar_011601 [Vaccinium darrowii]|uniref:Uncharacterized protein n=1 Tax=Vaccinium darrowii TaxID=229202 RepID=A0ACB7Y7S7_9ERIC|nr:hypothetical protein Vadar_011601 [Vaccinium darrowii]